MALKGNYYTKLDLYKGYYQLLVGKNSHMTALPVPK